MYLVIEFFFQQQLPISAFLSHIVAQQPSQQSTSESQHFVRFLFLLQLLVRQLRQPRPQPQPQPLPTTTTTTAGSRSGHDESVLCSRSRRTFAELFCCCRRCPVKVCARLRPLHLIVVAYPKALFFEYVASIVLDKQVKLWGYSNGIGQKEQKKCGQ